MLSGAYLGFCQGGCTFLADLPPPPWIRICIKILSWIRIRIKTMGIHSPGLNCQKIAVCLLHPRNYIQGGSDKSRILNFVF
jgi:hypothetical protein